MKFYYSAAYMSIPANWSLKMSKPRFRGFLLNTGEKIHMSVGDARSPKSTYVPDLRDRVLGDLSRVIVNFSCYIRTDSRRVVTEFLKLRYGELSDNY